MQSLAVRCRCNNPVHDELEDHTQSEAEVKMKHLQRMDNIARSVNKDYNDGTVILRFTPYFSQDHVNYMMMWEVMFILYEDYFMQ